MREKVYENKVTDYLESVGVYRFGTAKQDIKAEPRGNYFKVWGGGFQQAGIPDLICNVGGHFVAIELKASDGRPSKLQEINIDAINAAGGIGMISYPKDFSELKEVIERCLDYTL